MTTKRTATKAPARKTAAKKVAAKKTTPKPAATTKSGTRKTTAKKAAAPKRIIEVKHNICGAQFAAHPAIMEALNDPNFTGQGIDCPVCSGYRPMYEFEMVRG